MRMIPWLVVIAHDEWIFEPTKYRLSKTLAGSVNHVPRGAGGPGATSRNTLGTATGATHKRAKVPVESNPAAVLAAIKWASIGFEVFCASALAPYMLKKTDSAMPMFVT